MTKERRYRDDEVRQILDSAIGKDEASTASLPVGSGLTLRELQDVGREVGVAPERITEAVAEFEGRGVALKRATTLGLPTSVGSVLSLPRNPTDLEWERLVGELRSTFGVKGEVSVHGTLREWSNGTLHAFIEPDQNGYRLRLEDSRAAALGVGLMFGGFLLVLSLMILLALLDRQDADGKLFVPLFFSLGGAGAIALGATPLPSWAREQEERIQHICKYAVSLLAPPESSGE